MKKPQPGKRLIYIHDKYDIAGFMSPEISYSKDPMLCIINPLIEALNTKWKMPHHNIILLDEHIVDLTDLNVDDMIAIWFLSTINLAINFEPLESTSNQGKTR